MLPATCSLCCVSGFRLLWSFNAGSEGCFQAEVVRTFPGWSLHVWTWALHYSAYKSKGQESKSQVYVSMWHGAHITLTGS